MQKKNVCRLLVSLLILLSFVTQTFEKKKRDLTTELQGSYTCGCVCTLIFLTSFGFFFVKKKN